MSGTEDKNQPALGSLHSEPSSGQLHGLRKLRVPADLDLDDLIAVDEPIPVIVEVARPGYRPIGLKVRTEITGTFLTATVPPAALPELDRDPGVVAVEITRPLGMIE